jgi:hypothetical protein
LNPAESVAHSQNAIPITDRFWFHVLAPSEGIPFQGRLPGRELEGRRNFVIPSLSSDRISHSAGLEEAAHHAMDCFFSTSRGPLADTTMV